MGNTSREWFNEWFDSPYYHILYRDRDDKEAKNFINKLSKVLEIKDNHKILDMGCGKGRHAIYLSKMGYEVEGIDLSSQNIKYANQFANERLSFTEHDMRAFYKKDAFDIVLNLFTSFGYFNTKKENEQVICTASNALRSGGNLVIDFLNPYRVIHDLIPKSEKHIEGITFHITKELTEDEFIIKNIRFEDNGNTYHFQERVKAITESEFLEYFKKTGLRMKHVFGDYNLDPYKKESSERMILVAELINDHAC